jgi:hypothetical protein
MKLLEKKWGKFFNKLLQAMIFLDNTSKAQVTKARTDKSDFIKLQRFCTALEIINRVNQQKHGKKNRSGTVIPPT